MIASIFSVKNILGFFGSREGKVLLVVLAALSYVEWQKMKSADAAESELLLAISEAKAEEAEEWKQTVAHIEAVSRVALERDQAELKKLKEMTDELLLEETASCAIPDRILERLRAIR